jgi:predicted phosphoadenosine phosphosulfate sulfurtransferase
LSRLPKSKADAFRTKFRKSIIFWKKKGGSLSSEEIAILQDLGIKFNVIGPSSRSKNKMIVRLNQKTPDDTDSKILSKAPSWRRMCICVLKGDTDCNYMGF